MEWIDVSRPELYEHHTYPALFAKLRAEDPVHYCPESEFGPYWSITRYDDVMEVSKNPQSFSSDVSRGGSNIRDARGGGRSVITMDPPQHKAHRRQVSPALSPANLRRLEPEVRARTSAILDALPIGETFDWVERVATELPIQMLATLFGVPQEDRHRLLEWSNKIVSTISHASSTGSGTTRGQFTAYFRELREKRRGEPPGPDLISRLANGSEAERTSMEDYLSTISVLVVGGNDTTRNTLTGGLHALCTNPDQYDLLREDPGRIPGAVSEILRYVSPVLCQRRTAVTDTELRGKEIRAGDRVVLWYASANRDEEKYTNPEAFDITRREARHLAFGMGTHFCVGSRLAELQLRCFWEALLERYPRIRMMGEPTRLRSCVINGFVHFPVRIDA